MLHNFVFPLFLAVFLTIIALLLFSSPEKFFCASFLPASAPVLQENSTAVSFMSFSPSFVCFFAFLWTARYPCD